MSPQPCSLWEYGTFAVRRRPPIVEGASVYVKGVPQDGVAGLRLADGALLWRAMTDSGDAGALAAAGDSVWASQSSCPDVHRFRASDGAELWHAENGCHGAAVARSRCTAAGSTSSRAIPSRPVTSTTQPAERSSAACERTSPRLQRRPRRIPRHAPAGRRQPVRPRARRTEPEPKPRPVALPRGRLSRQRAAHRLRRPVRRLGQRPRLRREPALRAGRLARIGGRTGARAVDQRHHRHRRR